MPTRLRLHLVLKSSRCLPLRTKNMVEATSLAQADSFVQLVSFFQGTEVIHMLKKLASDHTSKELGVKPYDIFAGHIEQGLVKPGEVIGEKGRMGMRTPLTSSPIGARPTRGHDQVDR
jgi:hypothetical protein